MHQLPATLGKLRSPVVVGYGLEQMRNNNRWQVDPAADDLHSLGKRFELGHVVGQYPAVVVGKKSPLRAEMRIRLRVWNRRDNLHEFIQRHAADKAPAVSQMQP